MVCNDDAAGFVWYAVIYPGTKESIISETAMD